MKQNIFLNLLSLLFIGITPLSGQDLKKTKSKPFIGINAANGFVMQSNDFVSDHNRIPHYSSYTVKYGYSARGNNWKDYAYGLPTMGIGVYMATFHRKEDLGRPFSVFFFQGATLRYFNRRLSLNYEWNLGASFNWKSYDEFSNPENIAIGSSVNVHVGGNLYLNWRLSKAFDLNTGVGFAHFSNGASSLPNKGLNMLNAYVELIYHFNRKDFKTLLDNPFEAPAYKKHIDHDLMFLITSREARVDTLGTGLPTEFTKQKFKVLGLSYAYMFSNTFRYRWGPSIEAVYDESAGAKSWREEHPENHKLYDRTALGKVNERFSVGLSLKGEIAMPGYSVFANLGYNILHGNKNDARFYQILGAKLYLKENLFGTFGIRAENFGRAQYLFWNLGYTFEQAKKKKRK